ncbi:inner-membrane translocator [Aquibacillus kalidii]|uniref:inner-membrane translocator n=1 Tax=Aquibacillus kalidii TaxID=2762597 RepID=UPI001645596B|nr:inner-membrane translocator [Aquibacillus kalidii]
MEGLILALFILFLISLNVVFFILLKKEKLNLMVSGIIMMVLAPVIGFFSGALFLHFYDWSSGGTGEGAGYGGAFLGLITLANGLLILVIGTIRWFLHFVKKAS